MMIVPVTLDADLTAHNADSVVAALTQVLPERATEVVCISLGDVQRCDSAGIAALIEVVVEGRNRGLNLTYGEPCEQLLKLACFLKVDSLLFD